MTNVHWSPFVGCKHAACVTPAGCYRATLVIPPPQFGVLLLPLGLFRVCCHGQVVEKEYSIEAILKELAEIQNQGPKNVCVLGTRHCSFLHQQVTPRRRTLETSLFFRTNLHAYARFFGIARMKTNYLVI